MNKHSFSVKSKCLVLLLLLFRVTVGYSGGPLLRPAVGLVGTALRRSIIQPRMLSGLAAQKLRVVGPAEENSCPTRSSVEANSSVMLNLARDSVSASSRLTGVAQFPETLSTESLTKNRPTAPVISEAKSLGAYLVSIARKSILRKPYESKTVNDALFRIFNQPIKEEEWPYNFESYGFITKIQDMVVQDDSISFNLQIIDRWGDPLTELFTIVWEVKDGRFVIGFEELSIPVDRRNAKVRISDLICQKQRELIEKHGGSIEVTAVSVGAYTWANQGFEYREDGSNHDSLVGPQIMEFRRMFGAFIVAKTGVKLTHEELNQFTAPVHFAAFTNGKKYIIESKVYLPLNELQSKTRSLVGIKGEYPLSMLELIVGKSNRIVGNLGKAFMLNKDWKGVQDAQETEASRYAEVYRREGLGAIRVLNEGYRNVIERVTKESAGSQTVSPP